jgi:hypothetical protein
MRETASVKVSEWRRTWLEISGVLSSSVVDATQQPVPTIFARWWIQWEEAFPTEYPLPLAMHHFGPTRGDLSDFILDDSNRETEVSEAITRAWETLPDTVRQLMHQENPPLLN